jgi:hypothetical protein
VVIDYTTNRQTRELDRLCHAFVAAPADAGHLRLSVRAAAEHRWRHRRLRHHDRPRDRASTRPPAVVGRDIGDERTGRHMLTEALRSFQQRDVAWRR